MACVPHASQSGLLGRPMTRCECAGVPFDQVARELAEGRSLEEATHQTGCGQTCTACLPDLRRYLEGSPPPSLR